MYSRVTLVEIDPVRMDVDSAVERFKDEVVPGLEEAPGYEGAIVLSTPEGKGMVVTLWETAEAAGASAGLASEAVESFMTFFKAPPGREHYEVVYLDPPAVPVG